MLFVVYCWLHEPQQMSVCAGVPVKCMVAGVAMGLVLLVDSCSAKVASLKLSCSKLVLP